MPPQKSPKKASLSYKQSGVDIAAADEVKGKMAKNLETNDARVLNKVGAFASLYDASFPGYKHPVLVVKTEEPGSKQKIAFEHGRVESICQDMINHLVNDIIVMGATPLCVQDAIICGKMEKQTVSRIVAGIAEACKAQGCVLTGGETSEQPGMLEAGRYILTSSIIGIVEKSKIIDGSAIREGDSVIALESSGLHTNGYSLVRALMARDPALEKETIEGRAFLDTILTPHRCYFQALRGLFDLPELHGMAHITGGGIEGNLCRILPKNLDAVIQTDTIRIPAIFTAIREHGNVSDHDMRQTYNLGVGLAVVAKGEAADVIRNHLSKHNCESYVIGSIAKGKGGVRMEGALQW